MQIVPAIDLQRGFVVRAVGGRRAKYRPLISSLCASCNPAEVARWLRSNFGLTTTYVADLDAIEGADFDLTSYAAIASQGLQLWLDAGVGSTSRAEQLLEAGESIDGIDGIVVGLESIESPAALPALLRLLGQERAIFSLDLCEQKLITKIPAWAKRTPFEMLQEVLQAGFRRIILLDLADVGTNRGTATIDLCRQLKQRDPEVELIAGGGIRNQADLLELKQADCQAALVATALHQGQLTREELQI